MNTFSLFSAEHIKESYVFFDFETTGFYPLADDRVIEVALIKVKNGNVVATFDTLMNPRRLIPAEASAVNAIFDADVADSPFFDGKMSAELINFIDDSILVAHNAAFDLGFLSMELAGNGVKYTEWQAIDTLKIAQHVFSKNVKNKLKSLIDRYNIKQTGDLHRALVDTEALVDVFFNLVDEEPVRALTTSQLVDQFGFKENNERVKFFIPDQIREAMENNLAVNVAYKSAAGVMMNIRVYPVAPVWNENRWYIYGKNADTGKNVYLFGKRIVRVNAGA